MDNLMTENETRSHVFKCGDIRFGSSANTSWSWTDPHLRRM